MKYNSEQDTKDHIEKVGSLLKQVDLALCGRVMFHDQSKLTAPEKEIFDEFTPKLKGSTYGSDEYKVFLEEMGVALKHHYQNNRHHPEHFENGVDGMTLVDLIEMICDWKAATLRHENGDILKSLDINKERFHLSDQLYQILKNTVTEMGWAQLGKILPPEEY